MEVKAPPSSGTPASWKTGELSEFWAVTDCKHVTAEFVPDGYPLASIREVQSRFVDLKHANQTTERYFNELIEGGRRPRAGDLILSRNATVGEVALVADWHPPFAMGQDVCLLRKRREELSSEFLYALFESSVVRQQFGDFMVGSTFKRANVQQIRGLKICMPPIEEQERIASTLTDADALIDSLEQLLTKKRQIKQGAMQELLTGKRRLLHNGEAWRQVSLGSLGRWSGGMTPSMARVDYWSPAEVPWLSSGDLKTARLSESAKYVSKAAVRDGTTTVVPAKSVVVVMRSGILRKYLPVGITLKPMAINQDLKAIQPNTEVAAEFLLHALTYWGERILATCLKAGTTVESLELRWLKAFTIDLPPVPEQVVIAGLLSDIDTEIATLESRLTKARALKQAMAQALLTGRIRLVEPTA